MELVIFPEVMKLAEFVPQHKGILTLEINNYRPNLCTLVLLFGVLQDIVGGMHRPIW